ncbi:hypothetical protein [Sphingomonas fennica]|uniref:Uncharacterized protein n=1 Tax=Edaphosphingomonas fennica TaxID=114404 RepID=A0A2T4HXK2_9SPHN|nr:hypothetical protein [Sphingomonas fennica]PTD20427.1 hypothetical protein CV103_11355 [Sphingomonas fennica]
MSDSPNGLPELTSDLMSRAVCNTSHPADAVSALVLAAGVILNAKFGAARSIALLRDVIDETEQQLASRCQPPASAS